jgi:hypothetical protein
MKLQNEHFLLKAIETMERGNTDALKWVRTGLLRSAEVGGGRYAVLLAKLGLLHLFPTLLSSRRIDRGIGPYHVR